MKPSKSHRVRVVSALGVLLAAQLPWALSACSSEDGERAASESGGAAGQSGGGGATGGSPDSALGGSDASAGETSSAGAGEGGAASEAVSAVCSEDDWCWDAPLPQGNTLRATWAADWADVWAVGDAGTVIHYDGRGFGRVEVPSEQNLNAIWGNASGELWVAGDEDTLLHFDGASWQTIELPALDAPANGALYAVWGDGQDVWVTGSAGRVLHSSGGAFEPETSTTTSTLRALWSTEGGDVLAVGDGGVIVRRAMGTWKTEASGTSKALYAVRGSSAEDVYAAGLQGALLHYDGEAWKDAAKGATVTITGDARALVTTPEGCWWLGARGQVFFKPTAADADDWQARASAVSVDLLGAVELDGRLLAVGQAGSMVLWDEGTRTVLNSGSNRDYLALAAPDASAPPIVVGDGMQTRTESGWSDVTLDSERALYGVTFLNASTGLAVGTGGTILRQDGAAWLPQQSGTSRWLRAVWSDGSATWVVGEKGTILGVLNGTFSALNTGFSMNLYDVWGASADVVWAVGDGAVLRYTAGKWERFKNPIEASTSLRGIWGSSADDAWAVGTRGTLLHWNGTQWTREDGDEDYTLNDVWGSAGDHVWAVGTDGAILFFDGSSWERQSSGNTSNFNAVWGSAGFVWAAGEGGAILRHAVD